jgi:hypothetical protein
MAGAAEDFTMADRIRASRHTPNVPIDWLERPVPLWPRYCRTMVCGVSRNADEALRRYWLQLGRAASAGNSESGNP